MEENLKTEQFQDIIHSLNHLVLSQELFVLGANPGSESILEERQANPHPRGAHCLVEWAGIQQRDMEELQNMEGEEKAFVRGQTAP